MTRSQPDLNLRLTGEISGHSTFKLDSQRSTLGRGSDTDFVVSSEYVSTRHAEFQWSGEHLFVRDLGSLNGTMVNGNPATDWVEVRDGDILNFGAVQAVIESTRRDTTRAMPLPEPAHREVTELEPLASPLPAAGVRLSKVPIFISHSSEDKQYVRTVANFMRRNGWSVWIDESGIAGGKDYRGELMQALEATWVVVLLVSYNSMQSKWVAREIDAADRLGLEIIPVSIDGAPYPDALRMTLGSVQQIRVNSFYDRDRLNMELAGLDRALTSAAQRAGRTKPGKGRIRFGSFLRSLGVGGCLIGFALFIWLGFQETQSGPTVTDGIPPPLYGFGAFFISMIVAGVGESIRRAGMRKGI